MKISVLQNSSPARFAAEELAKYSFLMIGGNYPQIEYNSHKNDNAINLGLLSDFSLDESDLDDAFVEDIIDIDIKNGAGYIAGSNPRSILMGVYNFLKSAGCMWVRPGVEGEFIPKKDISNHSYKYRKKADYPFRGECTEGAISYESLRDMIYWMPKVGMNMLMNEGRVPFLYMHKWYAHINNSFLREPGFVADYKAMEQYIDRAEIDLEKTGLQYHNMGHGWMFEEIGVENGHNHNYNVNINEEDNKYLALTTCYGEGYNAPVPKRCIAGDSLFYTNFCYSNPEARKKLVDFWVKYAKEKPYIDYFHVWLGDAAATGCICEECGKEEFSDWYVMLLNEIDEALTKEGIEARFVFIMYVYTHRPPKKTRINNPDRFLLLYAMGINYGKGYKVEEFSGEIPPYNPSLATLPDQALGAKWREDWKKISGAKLSVTYEYRFYTDHFSDPGYMKIASETFRDMPLLKTVGFDGCMSDQTIRNFMPTGLPMCIMGEKLFDTKLDFESYVNDYFNAAFGIDGDKCRDYLETLTKLFNPELIRRDIPKNVHLDEVGFMGDEKANKSFYKNDEAAAEFAKIPSIIEAFLPTIEKNRRLSDVCHVKSWDYLKYHAHICTELSKCLLCCAKGDIDSGKKIYNELYDWISIHELEFAPVFDQFLFNKYYSRKFGINNAEYLDGIHN